MLSPELQRAVDSYSPVPPWPAPPPGLHLHCLVCGRRLTWKCPAPDGEAAEYRQRHWRRPKGYNRSFLDRHGRCTCWCVGCAQLRIDGDAYTRRLLDEVARAEIARRLEDRRQADADARRAEHERLVTLQRQIERRW